MIFIAWKNLVNSPDNTVSTHSQCLSKCIIITSCETMYDGSKYILGIMLGGSFMEYFSLSDSMNEENRLLVTDEPVEFEK